MIDMKHVKINKRVFSIKICTGLGAARGLMFDSFKVYQGAFIPGNAIWMPFVKEPLDLFFLDKNHRLIEKQEATPMTGNPRTWKVYHCSKAASCLEMRKGLVKSFKQAVFF